MNLVVLYVFSKECAALLQQLAKNPVCHYDNYHITKEGDIAGPRGFEHTDTVLSFV